MRQQGQRRADASVDRNKRDVTNILTNHRPAICPVFIRVVLKLKFKQILLTLVHGRSKVPPLTPPVG
jgi:hypothetical protein